MNKDERVRKDVKMSIVSKWLVGSQLKLNVATGLAYKKKKQKCNVWVEFDCYFIPKSSWTFIYLQHLKYLYGVKDYYDIPKVANDVL